MKATSPPSPLAKVARAVSQQYGAPSMQLVHSAACRLDQLNGQAATDFWKTLCSRLKTELFDTGQTYEDVRREILAFQAEVHRELLLLYEPIGGELSIAAT